MQSEEEDDNKLNQHERKNEKEYKGKLTADFRKLLKSGIQLFSPSDFNFSVSLELLLACGWST